MKVHRRIGAAGSGTSANHVGDVSQRDCFRSGDRSDDGEGKKRKRKVKTVVKKQRNARTKQGKRKRRIISGVESIMVEDSSCGAEAEAEAAVPQDCSDKVRPAEEVQTQVRYKKRKRKVKTTVKTNALGKSKGTQCKANHEEEVSLAVRA